MTCRSAFARRALPLGFATVLLGTHAGAETIDLYGVTQATLGWADADGPVAGYYVVVTPGVDPAYVAGAVDEARATVRAEFGDEITVSVAAFDASGSAGPLSPPSPTLRFNPPRDTSPPGDGDDPPTEPDPSEPPPDGGGDPPQPPGTPLDLTGDGFSDLLVRQPSGELLLWRMRGSTVLASDAIDDLHPAWQIVGGGDYDGNGAADLLWEEVASGRLAVSLVTEGKPGDPLLLDLPGLASSDEWRVGGSGDFDGNGRDDVMLFSRVRGESEIVSLAGGAVDGRRRLPGHVGAFSVAATADLDGDGTDEVVWRDQIRQELLVWEVDGAESRLLDAVGGWRVIGSGDFDGDGSADLFAEHVESRRVQVWLIQSGSVAAAVELPGATADRVASHVGDYDADARSDLVWHGADGLVEIWFSDGDAVSVEPVADAGKGSEIANGADGSDDSEFRARLCNAELNGDGAIDSLDVWVLTACYGGTMSDECRAADMDSDLLVTLNDFELFRNAFVGGACDAY
jgi:hypothetical protein